MNNAAMRVCPSLQVSHRRTLNYLAVDGETRTVAGAVPATLRRVPRDDASQMRATRRDRVHLTLRVPVDGGLVAGSSDDPALPGRNVDHVTRAAEAVPYEVRGLLQAFLVEALRGDSEVRVES
jgi:hypothetical protein